MQKYMKKLQSIDSKIIRSALAGLIAGALLLVAFRLVLLPDAVHYHADFAVYVNGQQEKFESDLYYEEVQSCSGSISPLSRTHLHQPDSTIVHVHDANVTWGHFFANLGWSLSNDVLQTDTELLTTTDSSKLRFILNGNSTRNIANKNIESEDRLLISYGAIDVDLSEQYDSITTQAEEFNGTADPAACKGSDNGFTSRLKRALWQ